MMLDIGAGNPDESEFQPEGFVLQDIEEYDNIDLVCDIRDLLEYVNPGECQVVRASHVLEHFSHKEIDRIFHIVNVVLKTGGIFHVIVPDLKAQSRKLLETDNERQIMIEMYGGQKDKFDFHQTGFTSSILKNLFERNGFVPGEITELDIGWLDCKAIKKSYES